MLTESQIQTNRRRLRELAPHLIVWGGQHAAGSLVLLLFDRFEPATVRLPFLAFAAVASLIILRRKRGYPANEADGGRELRPGGLLRQLWLSLPALVLLAGLALLVYTDMLEPYSLTLFAAVLLAFAYAQAGVVAASRSLALLGLWLLAFAAVIALRYTGYLPSLGGCAIGVSLMAGGWIVRRFAPGPVQSTA